MVAVAILSTDPVLRRNLEQLPRNEPAVVIVGVFDQPSSFPVSRDRVDVLLADAPTQELLDEYLGRYGGIALVVLLDGTDSENTVRALSAGARAVLDRSASRNEIIAAVKAVSAGLVVVAPDLLATLLPEAPPAGQWCRARPIDAP
jgi:DNA-binding NarL/FixJ family response regulator